MLRSRTARTVPLTARTVPLTARTVPLTARTVPLTSGLFYVETTTGVIRTKSSLSGHARQTPYDVTVTASDAGNPPLSSQTTVRVFINSRQTPRGKPRFIFPPEDGYHINIPEASLSRTFWLAIQIVWCVSF